jgi:hypothetical protein
MWWLLLISLRCAQATNETERAIKSIKKDDEKTNNNKNEIHCSFE